MSLIGTQDAALVQQIIVGEIRRAEAEGAIKRGSVTEPTAVAIAASIEAGDFCFIDTKEPRIAGWCSPLAATEVAVRHLWGPSDQWKALFQAATDFLLLKGFTTARWVEGNPLANAASQMTAASKAGAETSVNLAQAKLTLATSVVKPSAPAEAG